MNVKRKEIIYGILALIVIVICIGVSLLLNARDKKASDMLPPSHTMAPIPSPVATEQVTPEPTDIQSKQPMFTPTPVLTPTATEDTSREIGQSASEYEEGRDALEKELKQSKPKFNNVTEEIKTQFLANDIEVFWRELGIYIIATLGNQPVSEVTFLKLQEQEDVIICPMEISDSTGDKLFIIGIYDITYKYYKFQFTTDVYTYDTSPEMGEGGL